MYIYDCEVFPTRGLVGFKNLNTKEYTFFETGQEEELFVFFEKNKTCLFIGFNNVSYDRFIIATILNREDPYPVSQRLVAGEIGGAFVKNVYYFGEYDIFKDLKQFGYISLKSIEGNLGLSIEESPIKGNQIEINDQEGTEVIDYNKHDLDCTELVFYENFIQNNFKSRLMLIKKFNLSPVYMSKTIAQLISAIMKAQKNDLWKTSIEGIFDSNYLKLPDRVKLQFYPEIQNRYGKDHSTFKAFETIVAGIPMQYSEGGLHGALKNIYVEGNILLADVTAYYPSLIILFDLMSRNVADPKVFEGIYYERIKLKKIDPVASEAYKLVNNTLSGCMKDQTSNLYDPRMNTTMCVTGQLLLTMLIERLEPYLVQYPYSKQPQPTNLKQVNTDGIIFQYHPTNLNIIKAVIIEFEKETGLNLELTFAKKLVQRDVNNYILVTEEGKIKTKGGDVKATDFKQNTLGICKKALVEFFVNGTDPAEFIRRPHALSDFQIFCGIGKQFEGVFIDYNNERIRLSQKVNRVFAVTDPLAGGIFKQRSDKQTYHKLPRTPQRCGVLNTDITNVKNIQVPGLDYDYYLNLIVKNINNFLK